MDCSALVNRRGSYDNALAESVVGLFKTEVINLPAWARRSVYLSAKYWEPLSLWSMSRLARSQARPGLRATALWA